MAAEARAWSRQTMWVLTLPPHHRLRSSNAMFEAASMLHTLSALSSQFYSYLPPQSTIKKGTKCPFPDTYWTSLPGGVLALRNPFPNTNNPQSKNLAETIKKPLDSIECDQTGYHNPQVSTVKICVKLITHKILKTLIWPKRIKHDTWTAFLNLSNTSISRMKKAASLSAVFLLCCLKRGWINGTHEHNGEIWPKGAVEHLEGGRGVLCANCKSGVIEKEL